MNRRFDDRGARQRRARAPGTFPGKMKDDAPLFDRHDEELPAVGVHEGSDDVRTDLEELLARNAHPIRLSHR